MNSKKKHNINFTKPAEPAFITRLKQQAGYVEGPSVDTKKGELPKFCEDDFDNHDDEKPVVVVMNEGDFTEEEANLYEQVKKEVEKIDKADLSKRVIFKRKYTTIEPSTAESTNPKEVKRKKKEKKEKPTKSVLSFIDEEEEE